MQKIKTVRMQKQKGIALVMALIMLLLITVIGVASVRMTSADTQVSGNSMFSLMVYQGAESALGKVASNSDYSNILSAASTRASPFLLSENYFNDPAPELVNGAELTSKAQIAYDRKIEGSLYGDIPNSTAAKYQIFRTTAESRLKATAAKAIHVEGIAIQEAQP